jgi:hypothetical protein
VFVWKDTKSASRSASQGLSASSGDGVSSTPTPFTEDWTTHRAKHIIVVTHLSDSWRASYSCETTLASSVMTGPESFVSGDEKLMLRQGPTDTAGGRSDGQGGRKDQVNHNPNEWPSLIIVNVNRKVSDTGLRPINYTFSMFRLALAASSSHKDALKYVGTIPSVATKTAHSVFNSLLPAFDAYALTKDGPFLPSGIRVHDNPDLDLSKTAELSADIVIIGSALAPRVVEVQANDIKTTMKTPTLDRVPVVCITRIRNNVPVNSAQDVTFLSALDAGFWNGPESVQPPGGSSAVDSNGLLLLSSSGLQVLFVSLKSGQGTSFYESQRTWTLPVPAARILPSQTGCHNCVIYASCPPGLSLANGTANIGFLDQSVANNSNGQKSRAAQKILLSEPGSPVINLSFTGREFVLEDGEVVLEMKWQPAPKESKESESSAAAVWEHNSVSPVPTSISGHRVGFRPLLGILTSSRVLIFAVGDTLRLLNFTRAARRNLAPVPKLPSAFSATATTGSVPQDSTDRVHSIHWVGLSVVYTAVSGKVGFLLPSSPLCNLDTFVSFNGERSATDDVKHDVLRRYLTFREHLRLCGLGPSDFDNGSLLFLPRQLLGSESCKLLAVLPDRAIFGIQQQSTGDVPQMVNAGSFDRLAPSIRVIIRPTCVAEPLLLGLLSSLPIYGGLTAATYTGSLSVWSELLLQLVIKYYGGNPDGTSSGGSEVALTTSHASSRLCLSLSYAASYVGLGSSQNSAYRNLLLASVAAITGCCSSGPDARSDFPRCRWISPEVKFSVGVKDSTRDVLSVCADLLSVRPELLDILLDPVRVLTILLRRLNLFAACRKPTVLRCRIPAVRWLDNVFLQQTYC